MSTYSHSRISTFEQCRYRFKLQYIDKIKVEIPTTVEAFMGDMVHQTLEKLYKDLAYQKLNTKEQLIKFYEQLWDKEWSDDILIVKEYSMNNYKNTGKKYIETYYDHYKPFDQMTILGLETQDTLTLPDKNRYHIRIDKLACKGTTYFVCDYKTNSRMKDQEEADTDRQLAMYSIWVKDKFKDAKKVILLWHMLAFDKEATSERTDKQLRQLQDDVVKTIKKIETCTSYPTNVSNLCNYCVYKSICPSFKHEAELESKPIRQFKEDEGLKLVDRYSEIKKDMKTLKDEEEEIEIDLIAFAKQKGIDIVYGSNKKASVKGYDKIVFPEDKTKLIDLLKKKGLYEEFSMLCYPKLSSHIDELPKDIVKLTKKDKDYRISLSKKD